MDVFPQLPGSHLRALAARALDLPQSRAAIGGYSLIPCEGLDKDNEAMGFPQVFIWILAIQFSLIFIFVIFLMSCTNPSPPEPSSSSEESEESEIGVKIFTTDGVARPKATESQSTSSSEESEIDIIEKFVTTDGISRLPPQPIPGQNYYYDNGWGLKCSLDDLQKTQLISEQAYLNLRAGKMHKMDITVSSGFTEALFGQAPMGAVYDQTTDRKVTISEAMAFGWISQEMGMMLFEAQAANGRMIDPETGVKMTLKSCLAAGYISKTQMDAILNAECACLGFDMRQELVAANPAWTAYQKSVITKEQFLRWTEAQMALGGIIDPRHKQHTSNEYALSAGLIDEAHFKIIQEGEDNSWMYDEPLSGGKASYQQLMKLSIVKNDVVCLSVNTAAIETRNRPPTPEPSPPPVLVKQPSFSRVGTQSISVEPSSGAINYRNEKEIFFDNGWGTKASLASLYETGCIGFDDRSALLDGSLSETDPALLNKLRQWLFGISPIAGVDLPDGTRLTILEAQQRGILLAGTATSLLEAQAATGAIIDPKTGNRFTVQGANNQKLILSASVNILKRSENAVKGYVNRRDMVSGRNRSKDQINTKLLDLFQAIEQGLVVEQHGIRCLEAQIATGGLVDVVRGHRVPYKWARESGMVNDEFDKILSDLDDDTLGFTNPNSNSNQSYAQMLGECTWDDKLKLRIFPYNGRMGNLDPTKEIIVKREGSEDVTLQDVIDADLIDSEILKKFRTGALTEEERTQLKTTVTDALVGYNPIAGVYDITSDRFLSLSAALSEGKIKRSFLLDMLSAQAAIGKIIDIDRNQIITFKQAKDRSLYPADVFNRCEKAAQAFSGYPIQMMNSNYKLSLLEAIERKQILSVEGLKYIEVQLATGGIIDRRSALRLNLNAAVRKKLTTDDFKNKINNDDYRPKFTDIETGAATKYSDLLKKCKIDKNGHAYFPIRGKTTTIKSVARSQRYDSTRGSSRMSRQASSNSILRASFRSTKSSTDPEITSASFRSGKLSSTNTRLEDAGKLMHKIEKLKREGSTVSVHSASVGINRKGNIRSETDFEFQRDLTGEELNQSISEASKRRLSSSFADEPSLGPRSKSSFAAIPGTSSTTGGKRKKKVKTKVKRKALIIKNPRTNQEMTLDQALSSGLISRQTYTELKKKTMEHDSDSAKSSVANSKNVSPQRSRRVSRSNSQTDLTKVSSGPASGSETNILNEE